MRYMNEPEIVAATVRHADHAVLSPAARFLVAFMHEVNGASDGWAYWKPPVKAARKLMELLERGDGTYDDLTKALTPIKRFYSTHGRAAGMHWPEVL